MNISINNPLTHSVKTDTFTERRKVEQLAARRAHNPEVVGSSPTLAIRRCSVNGTPFFFDKAGLETFLRPV